MEETKKKGTHIKYIVAAAVCLILIIGGSLGLNAYRVNHRVAATVLLEVNPSIRIQVNEKERVLAVQALDKDGEIVIGDMDFSGSDVSVAVNALVGSMLRNGYLNELANSILISVDDNDPARGAALQKELTEEVNDMLESDDFFGAVLSQTITESNDLQQLSEQYGITLGKAQLIQDILNSEQGHTFEELVPLSINELNLLIGKDGADAEKVSAMGSASDKAYIGETKAKEIAFAHAGVSEADILFCEIDMDVERGVLVYEVDFKHDGYEYEYHIDAQSGDIVKNRKERDDDAEFGMPGSTDVIQGSESANNSNQEADYYNYHHEEPHHEDPHHGGTYYNGNAAGTGSGAGTGNNADTSALITEDQAKEIALAHAGQTAEAVYFKKAKQDYDDGVLVYEIEFVAGNTEYDYEIDAQTGAIRDYEWDYD